MLYTYELHNLNTFLQNHSSEIYFNNTTPIEYIAIFVIMIYYEIFWKLFEKEHQIMHIEQLFEAYVLEIYIKFIIK
jgi:hypothetical protein